MFAVGISTIWAGSVDTALARRMSADTASLIEAAKLAAGGTYSAGVEA
jgi:hypothetical protein